MDSFDIYLTGGAVASIVLGTIIYYAQTDTLQDCLEECSNNIDEFDVTKNGSINVSEDTMQYITELKKRYKCETTAIFEYNNYPKCEIVKDLGSFQLRYEAFYNCTMEVPSKYLTKAPFPGDLYIDMDYKKEEHIAEFIGSIQKCMKKLDSLHSASCILIRAAAAGEKMKG